MKEHTIGYIRVSTFEQNTGRQLEGLKLDKIFTDKSSGKDTKRPELNALMQYVRKGDTVVAHSMNRLARNLDDLKQIVQNLTNRGIQIQFVKESLTFSGKDSPMAILMLSVMGAFVEFERSLIRERQHEGIAQAKKRGAYSGRMRALSDIEISKVRRRVDAGETKAIVARDYRISRQTLYKYLKSRYENSHEFHQIGSVKAIV